MLRGAMRVGPDSLVVALWVASQLAIPLTRLRPGAPYPVSGRFAWSMFAGPLVGHCHHSLTAALADGRPAPLPPPGSPLRAVLDAREPAAFSQAVGLFGPYADRDADVARDLDDLLRRWSSTLPRGARVESDLRCASPRWPPFARVARFEGGAR